MRFFYVNDAEVPHTVQVHNPNGRSYFFRLRGADFEVAYTLPATALVNRTFQIPTGVAGASLPPGDWIVELQGNGFSTFPLTVTVARP